MSRSRFSAYRDEEEMYVYDQSCDNCRYYCDWEDEKHNGCKYYDRPDYEQYPQSHWCCDWKGYGRHRGHNAYRYYSGYDESHNSGEYSSEYSGEYDSKYDSEYGSEGEQCRR